MKKKVSNKIFPIKKKKKTTELPSSNNSFYVVGIGSSAGGLDALERFFENMTENLRNGFYRGIAFRPKSHKHNA